MIYLPSSLLPFYLLFSSTFPSSHTSIHSFVLTITITFTIQSMDTWTYDYMSEIMVCILNYLSKVRLISFYLTVTTVSIVHSTPYINLFTWFYVLYCCTINRIYHLFLSGFMMAFRWWLYCSQSSQKLSLKMSTWRTYTHLFT